MNGSDVDVLVLTALKDELDALIGLGQTWAEDRDAKGFRSSRCTLSNGLNVVAAWIGEMGQTSATARGQALIHELSPECLAMCGICAGDPEKVSLGDIVIANALWPYDEGKQAEAGFYHSMKMFHTERVWSMDAAFAKDWIDLNALAEGRPPTKEAQTRWLLHTLYAHHFDGGPAPGEHPARKVLCPDYAKVLKDAIAGGFVARQGRSILLTDAGKDRVDEDLALHPDGVPADPALRIHIGAMATGSAVMEDPGIFHRLRRVKRETIALDMEGAAIAELADREGKRFLVVKAVQDFANGHKDDTFRPFGCRASAMWLLAFLEKHLEPKREHTPRERDDDLRFFDRERERERENPFVGRVERAAALRHPNAKIMRHWVDAPFAGLLELEFDHKGISEITLVAALDSPITPELVVWFVTSIEKSFRVRFPLLRSTIVHTGHVARQDVRTDAFHKGIQLETFHEYQGLFDMKPYLEWQTNRLIQSPIYPPHMYVDAPAEYQVFGSREWTQVQNALEDLLALLKSPDQRRFALVLGEFGAGKTFLLRELARRMHVNKHPVWPVLVEMHLLEKRHDLAELLGAHFGKADVPGYNFRAFQYMLNEGRIALLFDGFDELADRVTYDTVTDHFNMVLSATQGDYAKVVLSSRRQHFLSESQVKLALAEQAQRVPGFRLVMLKQFGEVQIRQYLRNTLGDEVAADERYKLIDEVKDLLGLSHNPRMLGFIAQIPEAKLREAKARKQGEITSADLYELLVKQWLDGEHERLKRMSTLKVLSRAALDKGVSVLAMSMWHSRQKDVVVDEIRDVLAEAMRALKEPALDPNVVAHLFLAGSLLVRDAEGRFSFVHRSVMEWLVAREAAADVLKDNHSTTLMADEMGVLMADFFIDMTGRELVEAWAWRTVQRSSEEFAKKNATVVFQRIEKRWGKQPIDDDDIIVVMDLVGQDFRGQDLTGVDWHDADLQGANLERATLVGANLSGANLTGARLYRTNLERADLKRARFGTADLRVARLLRADLAGAEGLDSAKLFRTNFAGAKLPASFDPASTDPFGAPAVLGQTVPMRLGAAELCNSVAFDGTGELLAAGFADGTVRVFDAASGELLRVMAGHSDWVRSVAFSPDGRTIASGSDDNTVRLWDAASGSQRHALKGHFGSVQSVAFSPDGTTIVSGSEDKTLRLWDAASGHQRVALRGHSGWVRSVAFSADGTTIASGSYDGTLRLWDVASGRQRVALEGHSDGVQSVAFSPDGKVIASGSCDQTVRLWDVASGHQWSALEGHSHWVRSVAFSPDGNTIASASDDNTLRLWDLASGRATGTLKGHTNDVLSVAFSPEGKTLASASDDKTVRLWDVVSGRQRLALEGHFSMVHSVAFSPGGKTIASGSDDGTVRLWDAPSGRQRIALEGHSGAVQSVAFCPDGTTIVSGSDDKTVRIWDLASGRQRLSLKGQSDWVLSVAFSPDGKTIASGSDDKAVRLWDVASGRQRLALEGHYLPVQSVAFCPDGTTIASGSDDRTVRLWDVASGHQLLALEGHSSSVHGVAWSPDGKTIASGSHDNTVRLWDLASGRSLRTLEGHTKFALSVAWSPDGKTIASGSDDNTVRLWDATLGRAIRVLGGHIAGVTSVAFSPDSITIASGSSDGTIRLWSIASGQCYAILFATPEGWVAYSPDGRYKYGGNIAGSFWHVVGLCRFEVGELDLQLPDDADFRALRPRADPIRLSL